MVKFLPMPAHKKAIFPGTFDPLTNGHLDIITRALSIFDSLTVAILENSTKQTLFTLEERTELISQELKEYGNRIKVKSFSGLLVAFAQQESSYTIVRGLRAISDYDYEAQMALMNKNLCPDIETIFLIAREENSYISSSIVKQALLLGGDISRFVPPGMLRALQAKVTGRS